MIGSVQRTLICAALAVVAIATSAGSASAIPVYIDFVYSAVPGRGDTDLDMRAFFDDAALTNAGDESVTLSSLEVFITSATVGLNSTLFELPNTDLLCRSFPGVACFTSTPYTAEFRNGQFRYLLGVQGLHGTSAGSSNYSVNNSVLFQLSFNPARSIGAITNTRYALPTEPVHESLLVSTGPVTAVVPEPSTVVLMWLGLLGVHITQRAHKSR